MGFGEIPMERAFTLIELLVVVAIVALLAAILFPVFASAKEAAKKTVCLGNSKQLGLGIDGYVSDADDTLPMGGWIYGTSNSRWFRDVYPYVKSVHVFVCPSKTDAAGYYVPSLTKGSDGVRAPNSPGDYGIDVNLVTFPYSIDPPPAVQTNARPSKTLTEIPDVSGTFLLAETGAFYNTILGNYDAKTWPKAERRSTDWQVTPPTDYTGGSTSRYALDNVNDLRRPAARHNGGLNAIYCDGHAKWSRVDAFLGPLGANRLGWPYGDPRNGWDDR